MDVTKPANPPTKAVLKPAKKPAPKRKPAKKVVALTPAEKAARTRGRHARAAAAAYEHALIGHFVDVVAGEHRGLYGVYESDDEHGYALVRNRDYGNDFPAVVSVPVQHLRPSARTGGR